MATTNNAAALMNTGNAAVGGERDLHQLLLAPTVDWRHFQQRLEAQPDEARVLNAQTGWSVLQAVLARKGAGRGSNDCCHHQEDPPSSSSPSSLRQASQRHQHHIQTNGSSLLSCTVLSTRSLLRLVEHLLAIFPEAAWMGIDDSYTSPLHLVCRYHANLLSSQLLTLLLEARPTVLPYDQQALVDLWEHYVREFGHGNPKRLVAILSHYNMSSNNNNNKDNNEMSTDDYSLDDHVEMMESMCSKREARGIYLQLMKLLHYLTGAPVVKEHNDEDEDDDEQEECSWTSVNPCFLDPCTFLHRVAALTVDLDFLRLALSMNSAGAHQVDHHGNNLYNRLPMHCFMSNPPHERPPDDFDCFYDLHPLFDLLHQASPPALRTPCDAQGYLPLHIAIQAGWKDELVMDRLIYHYPESLECPVRIQLSPSKDKSDDDKKDDNSKTSSIESIMVLPFQLAALTPEASLTTVYRLVRQDPRIAAAAFGSLSSTSSPKLRSSSAPCRIVQQEVASKHTFHQQLPPLSPPATAPLTTTVLSQFVRAVGATHNVRLWRSMKVLLTTPTTTTTSMTTSLLKTTSIPEKYHHDDPLELLQQHLSTIASSQQESARCSTTRHTLSAMNDAQEYVHTN